MIHLNSLKEVQTCMCYKLHTNVLIFLQCQLATTELPKESSMYCITLISLALKINPLHSPKYQGHPDFKTLVCYCNNCAPSVWLGSRATVWRERVL